MRSLTSLFARPRASLRASTRRIGPAALVLALFVLAGCATPQGRLAVGRAPGAMFVDCRGPRRGAATIVLEAGAFGTSADWNRILRAAASRHRICAYDRAGQGMSPPATETPTPDAIARRLAATLTRIGETRPVIVAGHSNGGLYAETFARLYPDRTEGLLYVDGVGVDDLSQPLVMDDLRAEETRANLAVAGGRLGLAGLVVHHIVDAIGLTGRAANMKLRALTSTAHLSNSRDEVMQIIPGLQVAARAPAVSPDIPTAVIVASLDPDNPLDKAWRAAQVAPAERACQGWVLDMPGATHVSPLGRDRAYVLAALDWLETPGLRTAEACDGVAFKR